MVRIAHISDLHLSTLSLNPMHLFSKRWIGMLNLLFVRKKLYQKKLLDIAIDEFSSMNLDAVIATGDFSTTSRKQEFLAAKQTLEKLSIPLFSLPGNHDMYTKHAHKSGLFYEYFTNQGKRLFPYSLQQDHIEVLQLPSNWVLILLDCARATSIVFSTGLFDQQLEKLLIDTLQKLPKDAQIILANHFPFTKHMGPRKILKRADALREILHNESRIILYLHGHIHNQCIADLRPSKLPIILDPGSLTNIKKGSFHLMDLSFDTIQITPYFWEKGRFLPQPSKNISISH